MGFFTNAGGNGTLWVVRTVHYDDVSDPTTAKAVRATGWLSAVVQVPASVVASNQGPYALNDGDELAVSVKGGPDEVVTFHGSPAWIVAGNAGPYALADGETLDVRVDGAQAPIVVTFAAKAFANIGAGTPQEVVAVLAAALHGTTCDLSNGAPRITSATRGSSSAIEIMGGTAAAAFKFPQGPAPGGGNVPNLAAVAVADVAGLATTLAGVTVGGAAALSLQAVDPAATLQVRPATSTAFGFDPAVHAATTQTISKAVRIQGADPGTYADALQMVVQPGRTGMDLLTMESGTTRDRFTNVSLDPTSPRYIEALVNSTKTGSVLVRAKDQKVAGAGATLAVQTAPLSGGDDGLTGLMDVDFLGSATGKTGLQALNTVQDLAMLLVPGRATSAVHNGMIDYCEIDRSKQVFPILATPAGMSAQDIVTYVSQDAQLEGRSEFGAIFWPRIQVLNPSSAYFGNVDTVVMDPSGFIAGLFALNDSSTPGGIYEAAAGTESGVLAGVVGYETDECLDEDARDLVYPHRINPLTTATGQPFYVDGCYTLKADGDFPFIPQRRGVIFIERSLKTGLDWVRHKNNTRALRQRVYRTSFAFLYAQMKNGAFASTTPKEAFWIDVSDGAGGLNTPAVIASGQLLANYGLAMNTPAEWGVINVTKDTRALDAQMAAASQ
jgi:phage tail sheath protein FI